MFLACWGVLWLFGVRDLLGVLLAFLASSVLGYLVLKRLRPRVSAAVVDRWTKVHHRLGSRPVPTRREGARRDRG
ncbi:MAG: DUF4229 domain-containing protein [Streptosporangiales bacterium]|nr:DUF4229 domain-containing protein [Streptosporangiales bacterium]